MADNQDLIIAKNTAWIVGARIAQSLISVVVAMLTARYLGPSNYGVINYAASLVAFAVPIMKLGIPSVLVHEFVNRPEEEGKVLGSSMLMCFLSSLLCIVGIIAYAYVCNPGETETVIVCGLYSLLLLFQAFEVTLKWFQAHFLAKFSSVIIMIGSLIISGYRIFLLATGKSVYWFALTTTLDHFVIALLLFLVYCRKGGQRVRVSLSTCGQLFRRSKFYIVADLASVIYWQIGKVMIKQMLGATMLGYFSAAVEVILMSQFVYEALIDSFRPAIFGAKSVNPEDYEERIKRLYCIVFYLALAQSLVFSVFSRLIISVMYGADYLAAVPALAVISWFAVFSYFGDAQSVWILADGKQKYMLPISIVGATLNIFLNYFLIRSIGIVGAGIATVVTCFITGMAADILIKDLRPSLRLFLEAIRPGYAWKMLKRMWHLRP